MVSEVKDISIILAGIIAVLGFLATAIEYFRRGRQERAQHFLELRRRFLETPEFKALLNKLQTNDPTIAQDNIQERRNLVGFLEEVALLYEAKLLTRQVAHYMFGYYVRLVAQSEHFWVGLDPESSYWTVFWRFAKELEVAN
jgi:hypothetical protein